MERYGMWIRESLKVLVLALILAFILRAFFFEPALVRGVSMAPALHDNNRLLISKMATPKRFDIIIFHTDDKHDLVKRVIGLPGEKIEYQNDILYIDDVPYEEPYLNENKAALTDVGPLTNTFNLEDTAVESEVVPEGHLFVMGDNRRGSMDSRHLGAIPDEEVVGVSKLLFYPFNDVQIMRGAKYRSNPT